MTRNENVVLVSLDPADPQIKAGPFRQNIDVPSAAPEGLTWMAEYTALAANYIYPTSYSLPTSTVDALQAKAGVALAVNRTFLALETVTNAQAVAQIKALTRQVSALIRLEIGALDSTDGT